jgi:DNA-binding response OmpR family regulator
MKFSNFDDRTFAADPPGSASFAYKTAPAVASTPRDAARAATRILVVDDEPSTRGVVVEILRRAGYQVDAAEDGLAGWETLRTSSYHLLVTDHCMPEVTGVELIQSLRAASSEIPCLLMSGALPFNTPDLPGELQPGAMLQKPFRPRELVAKVDDMLCAHPVPDETRPLLVPA